jgi:lipopolysaccharide export system permease protein
MLLATLFTAGRLANLNEIIAIKNAGVSLLRFMMPFLLLGIIVTGISIYFNNWVVPGANKHKFFIERNYLGKSLPTTGLNRLYFQDTKNCIILIDQFKDVELTAINVSIQVYNPDTLTQLRTRIDCQQMKWENGNWILLKVTERNFTNGTEVLRFMEKTDGSNIPGIGRLNLKPEQIIKKQLKPDELDYGEISDFIDTQAKGGQNIDRLLVDFYSKFSFPFSNLIVVIFGLSISTGTRKRKGLALQFAISIMVSFIYLGFVKISQTFGYNGEMNPVLTAWMANIVFALFGGINLYVRNY